MRGLTIVIIAIVAGAGLREAAVDAQSVSQGQRQVTGKPATAADLSAALESTAGVATPAVVEIFTTSYATSDAASPRSDLIRPRRASGSGVIVDASGFIITNAHVVSGAQQLRVELPSTGGGRSILAAPGRMVDAQVVGLDLETDLAVIKVRPNGCRRCRSAIPTSCGSDNSCLR